MIWEGLKRVVRFFTGGNESAREPGVSGPLVEDSAVAAVESESPGSGILVKDLSSNPVTLREGEPVDLSRWTVTEHTESPFEKVGRLYVEGMPW